tara:strand:+ start:399 stop:782 length:384 start_codon:yes stop_codon:yes gene_type:complete
MASELRVNTIKDASGNNSIATSIIYGGATRTWFTLGVDAALDDSFNCSSVDDDGSGDFGIHFTANFNNALYASGIGMTCDGLNPRGMVQSPSKASDAVEVRLMSMNDGSATESNITHCEAVISGDPA